MKFNSKANRVLSVVIAGALVLGANVIIPKSSVEAASEPYSKLTFSNIPDEFLSSLGNDKITDISQRAADDLSSIVTVNDDGTETLYMFAEPVKYIDSKTNEIKFIDNTIIDSGLLSKAAYKSAGNSYVAEFPKSLKDGITFTNNGYTIKMTPLTGDDVQKPSKSNVAFKSTDEQHGIGYMNGFGSGTYLQYELQNSGLKESIILDKYDGKNVFEFEIQADGLVPAAYKGEQIEFNDKETGEKVFSLSPVFVEDSYAGEYIEGERHISFDNYYTLEDTKNGRYLLSMVVDEEFLISENTVYPVLIDPTIWYYWSSTQNNSAYGIRTSSSVYQNQYLYVDSRNTTSYPQMSYIQVPMVSSINWIDPERIINSNIKIYDYTGSNVPSEIHSHVVSSALAVTSATYSEMEMRINSTSGSTTRAGIYQLTSTNTTQTLNISQPMREWLRNARWSNTGYSWQRGIVLKNETPNNVRQFASTRDSVNGVPRLYVEVNYETNIELPNGTYCIKTQNGIPIEYNSLYGNRVGLSNYAHMPWLFTKEQDGSYSIKEAAYYLYAANATAGTQLYAFTDTQQPKQTWRLYSSLDGNYRIVPNNGTTHYETCVAINGSSVELAAINKNSNANQTWKIERCVKYTATVNNYFDDGYAVRYYPSLTLNTARTNSRNDINAYTSVIKNRYMELFGLDITMNSHNGGNAKDFRSAIDICKGTVTSSNIDTLCSHTTPEPHTRQNSNGQPLNDYINSALNPQGSTTLTNVYWSRHKLDGDYGNTSCSNSGLQLVKMVALLDPSIMAIRAPAQLFHELSHQYGAHDHGGHDIGEGKSCTTPHCPDPRCSPEPCGVVGCLDRTSRRPNECAMHSTWHPSLNNVSDPYILCAYCKAEIFAHLENHHKN